VTESPQDAHGRGVAEGIVQGTIEQRLRGVEEHLVRNNGSIAEQVAQGKQQLQRMSDLTGAIDRLGEQFASLTRTDAAVKAADKERREQVETTWHRISGVVTVIISLIAIAAVVGLIVVVATQ